MTTRGFLSCALPAAVCVAGALVFSGAPPACFAQAAGSKTILEGVITKRDANTITVLHAGGAEVVVQLASGTRVKERKKNPFRGAKDYTANQLVRGLNVQVIGLSTEVGKMEAQEIRIKDDDLRVAASLQSRVEPVESRLGEVEGRLQQSDRNAQRLAGQVDEVATIAKGAGSAAKNAQATGDAARDAAQKAAEAARSEARATNERITALDDYDVKASATVLFAVGSAWLTKDARAILDDFATKAKAEKGYVIEVTGYASSDGNAAANQRLSQRRAEAVVRHLTETQSVPLRRLVIPHGFGDKNPVAPNKTADGRKQNRRVEVRVLVSKGLAAAPPPQ